MLSLITSLLIGALFGAPGSEPLFELASARGTTADWQPLVLVYPDGRWVAGERSGRLELPHLVALRTAAMQIPPDAAGPHPRCRARPFAFMRLVTPRGRYVEGTPCGSTWAPPVADLAAAIGRLAEGEPPLVRLEEASVFGGAWKTRALVHADGRWEGRGGAGQLAPAELERLEEALARATFVYDRVDTICAAIPTTRYRLIAAGKVELAWDSPCGIGPDPSTVALQRLLGDLTGAE